MHKVFAIAITPNVGNPTYYLALLLCDEIRKQFPLLEDCYVYEYRLLWTRELKICIQLESLQMNIRCNINFWKDSLGNHAQVNDWVATYETPPTPIHCHYE